MITRVILSWCHNFAAQNVTVQMRVSDDIEGTVTLKTLTYPQSVLPADVATWEQNMATSKNATLATAQTG